VAITQCDVTSAFGAARAPGEDAAIQRAGRYFDVMGRGGDFAECYTANVTWTTTDTGHEVGLASSLR
jgi:hypothetical protein